MTKTTYVVNDTPRFNIRKLYNEIKASSIIAPVGEIKAQGMSDRYSTVKIVFLNTLSGADEK